MFTNEAGVVNLKVYEEVKDKQKLIYCNECSKQFVQSQFKIVNEKQIYVESEKEYLWLTYAECPFCGHKYKVLIDNKKTYQLKREYQKLYARLIKNNKKGREQREYQVQKFIDLRKKLSNEYKKVDNKYESSFQLLVELATLNN